ncbi:hypothetical protein [Streptomyces sp. NPDC059489]|uniref:hypothetical protein n=1 Tax=Streptomyces sp. NPDC059489 TaxID=3346849 RepID=UPI0036A2A5CF
MTAYEVWNPLRRLIRFSPLSVIAFEALTEDDRDSLIDAAMALVTGSIGGSPGEDDLADGVCQVELPNGLAFVARLTPRGGQWRVHILNIGADSDYFNSLLDGTFTTERDAPRTARATTDLAARFAGTRRSHLRDEWAAILAGSPEEGIYLTSRQQSAMALGFLLASLRMRLHDLARPAWRPVDWLLRAETRTNAFITTVVGAQAIYIVGDGGLGALATEVWEPCGAASAALYLLARWLRRVRGIELATSESEPADE